MICSKILMAFDGSDVSIKALEKAVEVAKLDEGIALHVLHVVNPSIAARTIDATTYANWLERDIQRGFDLTQKVERSLTNLANPHYVSNAMGVAEQEILRYAEEQHCDLIIMGSRGLNMLKEFILGSTSHHVAQNSKVPVLIVK
jgi:nucleotide-binding universal stress UspA family protein